MPATWVGGAPIQSAPSSFPMSPIRLAMAIMSAGLFLQDPMASGVITKAGAAPDVADTDLNTLFAGKFQEQLVFGWMTDFLANQNVSVPATSVTYKVYSPKAGVLTYANVPSFTVSAGVPSGPNQSANRQIVRYICFNHLLFNQQPTPVPLGWRMNAAPAIVNYAVPPAGAYVDVTTTLAAGVDISHTALVRGDPDLEEFIERAFLMLAAASAQSYQGARAYQRMEQAKARGLINFDEDKIARMADIEGAGLLDAILNDLDSGDQSALTDVLMG
jgi:hypothetical protein